MPNTVATRFANETEINLQYVLITNPDHSTIRKNFPENIADFFFSDCQTRVENDSYFLIGSTVSLFRQEDNSIVKGPWTKES